MSCIKCHKTIVLHNAGEIWNGKRYLIGHNMSLKIFAEFVYESNGYLFIREHNLKSYRN